MNVQELQSEITAMLFNQQMALAEYDSIYTTLTDAVALLEKQAERDKDKFLYIESIVDGYTPVFVKSDHLVDTLTTMQESITSTIKKVIDTIIKTFKAIIEKVKRFVKIIFQKRKSKKDYAIQEGKATSIDVLCKEAGISQLNIPENVIPVKASLLKPFIGKNAFDTPCTTLETHIKQHLDSSPTYVKGGIIFLSELESMLVETVKGKSGDVDLLRYTPDGAAYPKQLYIVDDTKVVKLPYDDTVLGLTYAISTVTSDCNAMAKVLRLSMEHGYSDLTLGGVLEMKDMYLIECADTLNKNVTNSLKTVANGFSKKLLNGKLQKICLCNNMLDIIFTAHRAEKLKNDEKKLKETLSTIEEYNKALAKLLEVVKAASDKCMAHNVQRVVDIVKIYQIHAAKVVALVPLLTKAIIDVEAGVTVITLTK